jgi:hypothetical protein
MNLLDGVDNQVWRIHLLGGAILAKSPESRAIFLARDMRRSLAKWLDWFCLSALTGLRAAGAGLERWRENKTIRQVKAGEQRQTHPFEENGTQPLALRRKTKVFAGGKPEAIVIAEKAGSAIPSGELRAGQQ